jgi:hypothetical protein
VQVPDNNGGSRRFAFETGGSARFSTHRRRGLAQSLRSRLNDLSLRLAEGGFGNLEACSSAASKTRSISRIAKAADPRAAIRINSGGHSDRKAIHRIAGPAGMAGGNGSLASGEK